VLREPSVVAINSVDRNVLAVGDGAREMLGRAPSSVTAIRPIVDGSIADYTHASKMLQYIIHKICGLNRFFKPRVVISAPSSSTSVQRRAMRQAALTAGARSAILVETAKAAALGASLPIAVAGGNFVLDLGAGVCDAAIVSCNSVVVGQAIEVSGQKIDEAIIRYIRNHRRVSISSEVADKLKREIGGAAPRPRETRAQATGISVVTGQAETVIVASDELRAAISPLINQITRGITLILESTPPELASDAITRGILLTGGFSRFRDIDIAITAATGLSARIAENPSDCVVIGIGRMIEQGYDLREDFAAVREAAYI
jgi:rod shape-determining protein MreB